MHVADMVAFWGRTIPRRPAIVRPEGVVTYAALAGAIDVAADYFAHAIPDRDKPVAVSIDNAPGMIVATLGLFSAGFSVVPVSRNLLAHVSSTGADTLVHGRDGPLLDGGNNVLFEERWPAGGAIRAEQRRGAARRQAADVRMIVFTSGTTGKPKQVVQSRKTWQQRLLLSSNATLANYERALIVPGLSSSYGLNRAYDVLHAGKTACFAASEQAMLWLANTYDADLIVASTQQALALADIQEKITRYPLVALKTVKIGGSVITRDGIERLRTHLCRNVINTYSSTEAGTVAIAPFDAIADVPGAVGYIVPGVEVEIVDHLGNIQPAGAQGFIRLRSPQFVASLDADADTTWFYPGDFGSVTEDGVLCIMGRSGDVVNRGGTKLSTTDFESFLTSCAGVQDAGICTHMGEAGYEEVWAGVVLGPAIDLAAFRRHIEANAQFGHNIDKLFVVESIPRNELGKIQHALLKEMLESIEKDRATPA
jgi:acyl-coenzyme A synthetase/AMP-(fatty) acid ligase